MAAVAADGDQTGVAKAIGMKRQVAGRDTEPRRDLAGPQTFRTGLDQQAEHIEPGVLGERRERRHNFHLFHISIIIELCNSRQDPPGGNRP